MVTEKSPQHHLHKTLKWFLLINVELFQNHFNVCSHRPRDNSWKDHIWALTLYQYPMITLILHGRIDGEFHCQTVSFLSQLNLQCYIDNSLINSQTSRILLLNSQTSGMLTMTIPTQSRHCFHTFRNNVLQSQKYYQGLTTSLELNWKVFFETAVS